MRPNDFELFIIRHGEAESWSAEGDFGRPLTSTGRAAIERVARTFAEQDWFWNIALTSPLLRARETGEIIRAYLAPLYQRAQKEDLNPLQICDELQVESDPHRTAAYIRQIGRKLAGPRPRVAVFGHNPNLSSVLSVLLAGHTELRISLGRGDLAHLLVPAPSPFDSAFAAPEDAATQDAPPDPPSVLLGLYPRPILEKAGQ